MPNDAKAVTEYEQQQARDIATWKSEPPSVASRAVGIVAAPVVWLVQRVIPSGAIRGALEGANWIGQQLSDTGDICRDGGVRSISEMRTLSLERSDRLADGVHNWAIGFAIAEGAGAGTAGLPGLVFDVPAAITWALRTVHKIGLCYGYEGTTELERSFIFGILSASGANSVSEKMAALTTLRSIEVMIARQTWKELAQKAATNALSKEGGVIAVRNLAKQLGINLTKRKALQAIPVIGAGVGAAVNGAWIRDVGWAARRAFQERWLIDNGKVTDP
jgi:hypothetical protein